MNTQLDHLIAKARAQDRSAVAKLLTHAESGGTEADYIDQHLTSTPTAPTIGITGPAGAGKSTLIAATLQELTHRNTTPAVLAVDPSSPFSGGAILGDRVRITPNQAGNAFIRSLANRGHPGGIALAVPAATRILNDCGFNPIIIETVGAGQSEISIAATADLTVIVLAPGMGDSIQANKAGLLEIADIFVVNKADRPDSATSKTDLEQMLNLRPQPDSQPPPILLTTATTATGIEELLDTINARLAHLESAGILAQRRSHRLHIEITTHARHLLNQKFDDYLTANPLPTDPAEPPASTAAKIINELLSNQ